MPRVKTISDEAVLDAALNHLLEHGPHRFTLPAVGRAVGLAPATLLQRFGSKKGLLAHTLDRAAERLQAASGEETDTADARADLVRWLVGLAVPFRSRAHVASNLALLTDDLVDEKSRQRATRHMQIVREGIARHLCRLGGSAAEVHVDLIEAQWHGLVIQWALTGHGDCAAWVADGLATLLDAVVPAEVAVDRSGSA